MSLRVLTRTRLIPTRHFLRMTNTSSLHSAMNGLDLTEESQAGPSSVKAADKWVKVNGPPVGVTFGARRLKDEEDVFSQNAWDHAELPADYNEKAQKIMEMHQATPVAAELREGYNASPAQFWNVFYQNNQAAFFKDRAWLRSEFPEMIACSEADAGPKIVLEVGCGAGNSIFTLMNHNENPELLVYATDYSSTAVEVVESNPMFPVPSHGKGKIRASVWDITSTQSGGQPDDQPGPSDNYRRYAPSHPRTVFTPSTSGTHSGPTISTESPIKTPAADVNLSPAYTLYDLLPRPPLAAFSLPEGIQPGTVDVITVIYVLSALHPKEWEQAIHNLYTALKPGGILLLRDYGRYDLAQIRIKKDRLLDPEIPNLYIRGDGTRVYFFEKEELEGILKRSPRNPEEVENGRETETEGTKEKGQGMFEVLQLGEDRRMIVNRKERKTMFRIWMQVKARKVSSLGKPMDSIE